MSQSKMSVIDDKGTELVDPKSIVMEYERELKKRLSPRIINPEYKELEQSTLKLFNVRLNLSHIRSECEDFTDEEIVKVTSCKFLKNGKAMDPEGYINELFNSCGYDLRKSLKLLCNKMKSQKAVPSNWEIFQ